MRALLRPTLVRCFDSSVAHPLQRPLAQSLHHCDVPVFSRFLGIAIAILVRDHNPPYFHPTYGEFEITVTIRDGNVRGAFPPRARGLVLEWLQLHRDELLANWDRARRGEPLVPTPPLD